MSKVVHIGAPYISSHTDNDGKEYTRLSADIEWIKGSKVKKDNLYYEVETCWGKYFVTELCDNFVLSLLEVSMEKGYSIHHDAPMSEDLRYNLERYLIPIFSQKFSMLNPINIEGPISTEKVDSERAVGTGFSGGVDSFYTVLTHMKNDPGSKKLSHLVLAVNGGAMTGFDESIDHEWFNQEMERFAPIAEKLNLNLVGIRSNVTKLNEGKTFSKGGDAMVTLAFIHSLRRLFGTYMWASAWPVEILKFDPEDGGSFEQFLVPLLSVDGLRVYLAGYETTRMGKEKFIADFPIVQNNLTVCGMPHNCGRCFKCLRTMSELYSIGKLEKFKNSFPVDDFLSHLSSRLAEEFAIDHPEFIVEIKREMRKNNIKIPFSVNLKKWMLYKPMHYFRRRLRHNRTLMKLFYKYGFDEKLNGVKQDERIIKKRLEGKGKSE